MRGFTLLEVLIATALTALILSAVYGAYVSNLESIEAGREAARMQQTSRIFFDLLAKDVRCAMGDFLGVYGGLEAEDQEVEGKPADRLQILTSASHAALGGIHTGLSRVAYDMIYDAREEKFILNRTQETIVGEASSAGMQTYELTRMAVGLDLLFLDAKGRELKSWGTGDAQDLGQLPALVRVSLTLKDSSGQKRVFVTSIRPELADPGPLKSAMGGVLP
jgi:general secretion pathway protein J